MNRLLNSNLSGLVAAIVVTILYQIASHLTGFGAWVDASPAAGTVIRVIAVLLFGAAGATMLVLPMFGGPEARPVFYRVGGVLLLAVALLNATILFGDPLHIRPE